MKITKKIMSVLLCVTLIFGLSATAFAKAQASVTYYVGNTVVKSDTVTIGESYIPESFMLDAQYIPDGSYFTGWYTDAACTNPVAKDDLTKEITITGDFVRYAGIREYEESFTPALNIIGSNKLVHYPLILADGTYVPYVYGTRYQRFAVEEDYYKNSTGGACLSFFHDANKTLYQADSNSIYRISFEYMYSNTNTSAKTFVVGLGYKESYFDAEGKITSQAPASTGAWATYKSISMAASTETTEWTNESFYLTLSGADLSAIESLFGIGNGYMTGVTYKIRNLKVEKINPGTLSVVYNYIDAGGNKITKTIDGKENNLKFGDTFPIDFIAPNTADKYFVGWYTDESFSGDPVSKIDLTEYGENHLYARYKEYKTSFSPVYNASHGGTDNHFPSAYYPVMRADTGVYYNSLRILNYSNDGINIYEEEYGSYYSFLTNGQSALWFVDQDNFIYQVRSGVSYRVTFDYKHNGGGDGSLGICAAIGLKKSDVDSQNYSGNAASYGNALTQKKSETITVNNTSEWKTAEVVVSCDNIYLDDYHAIIGFFVNKAGYSDGEGFYFKNVKVEAFENTANEEAFVSFENYSLLSKNAMFDRTNKYAIALNKAEYTTWGTVNNNGVWADPTKTEKEFTIYKNKGFAPNNLAIVDGGYQSEKALKFKQTASGTQYKVADISNGVFLKDNTTYTATFYYKAEGSSDKDLKFSVVNALNSEMLGMITDANTVVIPANEVASDWTKVVLTFTTDFGYHNADYAVSQEMFCIPVLCINHDINDTERTVYVDSVSLETSIASGGVSVLDAEAEAIEGSQALRVYFNYLPDENGKITIGGEKLSVVKRGVLLAPAKKLNNKTDENGNFIREKVETPQIFVKENASEYGFIASEKSESLTDCWANENGVLTYSVYIKNFEVNDENEIAVRGWIELSDGRVVYSDIYSYSVNDVKAVDELGSEKTYYDFSDTAVADKLVLQGNTKVLETGVTADWNSQTVKMKAYCAGDIIVKVHKSLGTGVRFKVLVDGNRVTGEFSPVLVDKANNVFEFTVNIGNKPSVKEIQIVRLNEVTGGPSEIMGVELLGKLLQAEQSDTLIEFLGDSISHGNGDGSRTYAFLAAQRLGFDFRIRSRSGMGFAQSNDGWSGIGKSWNYTYEIDSFLRSQTTPYSFDREADVMCIYLGTNDHLANQTKAKEERDAIYIEGMKNLISIVKEYNPNAKFVWITGGMTDGYKDAAISVMNELGGEENGHYVFSFSSPSEDVGPHPSTAAHTDMAVLFADFLTEKGLVK